MDDWIFWCGVTSLIGLVGFLAGYLRGVAAATQVFDERWRAFLKNHNG